MRKKLFYCLIAAAVLIKLGLWIFTSVYAPQGKFENDSLLYMQSAGMIAQEGVFAIPQDNGKSFRYEQYRTPGYPLFIAVLNGWCRLPYSGVILAQILLSLGTAWLTSQIAGRIESRLGPPAGLLVLFDPTIMVSSLMIMSETLFIFLFTLFVRLFLRYVQQRKTRDLFSAALVLSAAVYIRPIVFYLGGFVAVFILLIQGWRFWLKGLGQALLFFALVYSLLGLWQYRNHIQLNDIRFSTIEGATSQISGIYKSYGRDYMRLQDPQTAGRGPVVYYISVTARATLGLFTQPLSFKYWGCKPLTRLGQCYAYPFLALVFAGFILGLFRVGKDPRRWFVLLLIGYFYAATLGGALWGGPRFRAPVVPLMAIVSASGWYGFWEWRKRIRDAG
ncbi:MAG: glycosyltransferase family 39 protein [Candidatus Omnitrophica bacterium]|nr:glycosyltransferase family 39 protein [Candidatus Omnitrophota bacterium]